MPERGTVLFHHPPDVVRPVLGTEIGPGHRVRAGAWRSGLVPSNVPGRVGCAERATGIAGRGLDPDVIEDAFLNSFPLATQFNATPPARTRLRLPVSFRAVSASRRMISSVTF